MKADRCIDAACATYGISRRDMLGPRRQRRLSRPRAALMWALRHHDMSLPEVGAAVGGRHHTTVMHAVRLVEADPTLTYEALAIWAAGFRPAWGAEAAA